MIERLFEVVDLERNTFKLIHSELIQQVQCVEFNLKRIYAAMCQGDFDDNFHSLDNANLGKIVRELKRLDHSDGCPELMLMCGKVTHKNLIDNSPSLFLKLRENK